MTGVDKIYSVTGYNIGKFFSDVKSFIDQQYLYIADYYSGGNLTISAFNELNRLSVESKKIEPLFELYKGRLNTIDIWEVLDVFSEVQTKIEKIQKSGKWLRSSRLGVQSASVKITSVQAQNETFEDISKRLGDSDYQNNWMNIAASNLIREEDYTRNGGTLYVISLTDSVNFDIPNIIDYFTPDNVYGKDLTRNVEFVNNDLATISGINNLNQNFEIKVTTFKNSIPEFPESGIDPNLIGGNKFLFQYPSIMRDIIAMFTKDARFSEIRILDIIREEDLVSIKIEARSVKSDGFIKKLTA